MNLRINPEFARRHLFVTVLMAALGCWFAYDGLVKYPATPAAALYESIENAKPPAGLDLEAFKRQKTQTQYGFAVLAFLAALAVGGHLALVWRFRFSFGETSYVWRGERHLIADVRTVDRSRWASKGILVVDGIKLDAWHHLGVKEFEAALK